MHYVRIVYIVSKVSKLNNGVHIKNLNSGDEDFVNSISILTLV